MRRARTARASAVLTVTVTLCILASEFVFLTIVYRLDDRVDEQRLAHSEFSTALAAWSPGADPGLVLREAGQLAGTRAPGADTLEELASAWAADPTSAGADRLRQTDADVGAAVVVAQQRSDRNASLTHASLLLVSIGWFLHEDLVGSSLLKEADGSFSDGQPREISVITLDEALSGSSGPYLVKADVQGAELEVLRGAEKILNDTEYIILEVSLFQSIINAPLLFDVISFMKDKGFVAYDIISFLYRPLDQALSQVDMAFVKENGQFRKDHGYCTPEQRREQNKKFREELQRLLA